MWGYVWLTATVCLNRDGGHVPQVQPPPAYLLRNRLLAFPTCPHFLWHCVCHCYRWLTEVYIAPGFAIVRLLLRAGDDPKDGCSEILRQISEISPQKISCLASTEAVKEFCLPPLSCLICVCVCVCSNLSYLPFQSYRCHWWPSTFFWNEISSPSIFSVAVGNAPVKSCNSWVMCTHLALGHVSVGMHCTPLVRHLELQLQTWHR